MKKILIVDDNENNRFVLRSIIENYFEQNGGSFHINEVANGIEAVSLQSLEPHHLIFMDIMMPEMDGIKATYKIRQIDPKVLIVAVSAISDKEQQKVILRKGAEDYISKPINTDVFNARFSNYLVLLESRYSTFKSQNISYVNLFTDKVYSYQVVFFMRNEDELSEFWEYYLLNNNQGSESLSDTILTFYTLGTIALKLAVRMEVIAEESCDNIYLTMNGINNIDTSIINLVLHKVPAGIEYKLDEDKLSFCLHKFKKAPIVLSTKKEIPIESCAITDSVPKLPVNEVIAIADKESFHVYSYLDDEDLYNVEEYISSLNSLLLLVGNGDVNRKEVEDIVYNLKGISKLTITYSESYSIAVALNNLAVSIEENMDNFLEKSHAIGGLCSAFSLDLSNWFNLIFKEGAISVDYMDDMIISNSNMLSTHVKTKPSTDADNAAAAEAVDIDDIFNF
ncbi:MAG: response regulator [Sulfuricurvum sp.]|uniref:response regulator n=1 Tax=Sulfuricurvum sp. TaxID=2025608 RepID=UPI0025E502F1|nr:response regulator [Sulfuricurvum sp.]MBV5321777.1 response regulator [Sulfuricurvum sp.]